MLLGTFGYAGIDAVLVMIDGGGETALGSALVYSILTLVVVVAVRALLADGGWVRPGGG